MEYGTDYDKIEKSAKTRKTVVRVITYVFLVLWAVIVLFPFYWMILTSVKSYSAYNSEYIPKFFTLSPTETSFKTMYVSPFLT